MHVTSSGKNIRVTDGISTRGRHEELTIEKLHDTTQFVIGNHLLENKFKVFKYRRQTSFIDIREASINDGLSPWLLGTHDIPEETTNLIEEVLDLLHASVGISGLTDKGTYSRTGGHNNPLVHLDINKDTLVVSAVNLVDITANGCSNDTGNTLNLIIRTVELGNVDKGGNSLLSTRGNTNSVQSTGEETTFNLHNLGIDLSSNIITTLFGVILGIIAFKFGKVRNVLIKVASPRGRNNGVDNGRSTCLVPPKPLVGRDEFLQLLQSLVQTSVLRRRGEV
mmetsp:Transcript_25951/g.55790  ORF Transcript_25951/g.55790 Transcript_25951/m.55790 type:complete len:280 (-) Transcript_25951:2392-3231(-)